MRRRAWAAVAALLLGGCATAPRAPEPAAAGDPAALSQWTASGRMAIAAGDEGGSGSFDWRQDGATSRLDVRGPLGAGALRVTVAPGALTIADGAGRTLDAAAAEAALRSRLGADLPWSQLRYWMLGLPAPGPVTVEEHAASPWRTIEQDGWRLSYESFEGVGGFSLPRRFTAQRPGLRVRVIVDAWTPGTAQGLAPEVAR